LSTWRLGWCSIRCGSGCRCSARPRWGKIAGLGSGYQIAIQADQKRMSAPDIRARKGGAPIVSLTSYHAHTAALLDKHCDLILVGDSLGMVMHGLANTVP